MVIGVANQKGGVGSWTCWQGVSLPRTRSRPTLWAGSTSSRRQGSCLEWR
jgi:hypothetical protein